MTFPAAPQDIRQAIKRDNPGQKQGIAAWYVLDMHEKSWGGFEIHTRQGWNVGQAPYGYLADSIPHPVSARRAEGKHKSRLAPDPQRASAVRRPPSARSSTFGSPSGSDTG